MDGLLYKRIRPRGILRAMIDLLQEKPHSCMD